MKPHFLLPSFIFLLAAFCPAKADLDKTLGKLDFQDQPEGPFAEKELPFKQSKIGDVKVSFHIPEAAKAAEIVKAQLPGATVGIADKALRLVWGPSIDQPELPAFYQIRLNFPNLVGSVDNEKPITFEIVLRSLTEKPGIFFAFRTGIAGKQDTYAGGDLVSADGTPREGAPAYQWKLGFTDKRTGENYYTAVSPFASGIWTTVRVTFAKRADGDGFDVTLTTISAEREDNATERVSLRGAERQGEVPDQPSSLTEVNIAIGDHDPNRAEIPIEILSMRMVQ